MKQINLLFINLIDKNQNESIIFWILFTFKLSFYLGLRGGRLTAHHYLEEGYKIHTTDKNLIARAKDKWQMEE
jgi:hypothetical protein